MNQQSTFRFQPSVIDALQWLGRVLLPGLHLDGPPLLSVLVTVHASEQRSKTGGWMNGRA